MDTSFRGAAKRLDPHDYSRLAQRLNVGEDVLRAFVEVETRGTGFDQLGRPVILFEPHVFYRNLPKGAVRDRAVRQGLAYRKWGDQPYPADSYPQLHAAVAIDAPAALKACSWGLGQVLGENHAAAGFRTVEDMVAAMMDDEEKQLEACICFIIANGLDILLRRHDWTGFARGYNGPAFARNRYDEKLAESYRKWSAVPATRLTPKEAPVPPTRPEEAPQPGDAEAGTSTPAVNSGSSVPRPASAGGVVDHPNALPSRKMMAVTLGASIAAAIQAVVTTLWPQFSDPVIWHPAPVVLGLLFGYFSRERKHG